MPGNRHELFTSSLEQAQQQFDAAAHIGFESRALNLYYGISQAGRAISAALTPVGSEMAPEVSGHGLRVLNLRSVQASDFWEVEVRGIGGENSSYGRLAYLLNSDPLDSPVTLGAIWHMIPELCLDYPIGHYPELRGTDKPYFQQGEPIDHNAFIVQATATEIEKDAQVLRRTYPDLIDAELVRFGGGSYSTHDDGTRTDEALFTSSRGIQLRKLRNDTVLMPACNDGSKALDPLLTWWVLLYTLSMVTRYEPVIWTRIIDVNRSPIAVLLETALSKALEAVPVQMHASLISAPSEH
ncbi:hypothetical protein IWX65_003176 [Arthrobacter sp. CAN_A214]|uniref:YaaC family protein n=1 Tax=Arthrobacter sp. CAN_A214 TaxID=2787720 RepID=UPI001A279DFF